MLYNKILIWDFWDHVLGWHLHTMYKANFKEVGPLAPEEGLNFSTCSSILEGNGNSCCMSKCDWPHFTFLWTP